jgi:tetratricopeptide (TPR) repeat protein
VSGSPRDSAPGPGKPAVPQGDFVDALVSAVLRADPGELAEDADAIGQDIVGDAEQLRERFLERVARAQDRRIGRNTITEASVSESTDPSSRGRAPADPETPPPPKIGRYAILRRLGAGGMGVVYVAYDEVLDRRLAIKVLHGHVSDDGGRRRERLFREAQAMARVSHPNLITVHEVGTSDAQLFIAMEFVSGPTLKQWLAEQPRSWREVVAVFIQIAEGLAALHDAGLVHRDVKPANVIIGDDGRVRVLDLGLVGAKQDEAAERMTLEESSSFNRIEGPLTMTGERLGTPAYMSREQYLGLELTPASDIFALSVVLHEALFRAHPFMTMATTFYELQSNVLDHKVLPPPSSNAVPAWLATLVARGYAADPKDRPESMRAYVLALSNDPGRTRRRILATVGVAMVAAIAGVALAWGPASDAAPTCDGGDRAIAQVWDEERASEVHAAMLATERPYAAPLADRITAELDAYAQAWAAAHARICEEHARGDHSAALLDARMTCLHHRRQAMDETISLLTESNAELMAHAGEMVAKLPRLEPCDDLAGLSFRASSLPPEASVALERLEAQLGRVEVRANGGRIAEAIALAREIAVEAEALGHPPTVAAALLAEVRASIVLSSDRASTSQLIERALTIAIVEDLDSIAAEAMILRMYLRGLASGGSEAALADLPLTEAMLSRVGHNLELRALLENNAGAVHLAAGDRVQARAAFERALVLKERLFGDDHLELALGLANLAILADDEQERREFHRRTIGIYERALGPEHPRTLDAHFLAAMQIADPEGSSAALRELCPRLLAIGDPRLSAECELARGRIEFARGRIELGREALARSYVQLDDEHRRVLLDAYLGIGTDAATGTIPALSEQIAAVEGGGARDWWVLLDQAERRLLLAWLLADTDRTGSAESLERAIVELEQLAEHAPTIERERLLALAQSTLARALAKRGDLGRVATLAADARAHFERWPTAYAVRLTELESLMIPPTQSMEP